MVVSLSIVSDKDRVPGTVDSHGAEDNVGVIQLVVVAHPRSDESPESFNLWVSSEFGNLLWLSSYNHISFVSIFQHKVSLLTKNWSVPKISWSKLSSEWGVVLLVEIRNKMRHI